MKLRTVAFWVMAWAHLATAWAADVDWGTWSAERRAGYYRDTPGEIRQLSEDVVRAREAKDAVAADLALGRLLVVLDGYDETQIAAVVAELDTALAAARKRRGADAGRFSLLIGAASHQVVMQDGVAVRDLLDEAQRVAIELRQPAMRAEVEAVRALSLVYDGDAVGAQAAAQRALELSSDPLLAEQLFQGPQFISRVLSIHQVSDADPLMAELDQRIAKVPEALPYLSLFLTVNKVVLYRRIRQPEAAQRVLKEAINTAQQQPGFVVPRDVRLLQANLYQDTKNWDGCIEALQLLVEPTESFRKRLDADMTFAVCYASKKSPQALHYIDELDKELPTLKDSPAMQEAVFGAQARAYELLGDIPAAYGKLKAMRNATLQRVAKANEAMRQRLQTTFDVAAKDKENLVLKNRQEVLERARLEIGLAACGLAIGLAIVGELLRRQAAQRRRLAQLSQALEKSNGDLVATNGQLESLNASRTRLLTAACHDLRQPAHALGMLAEIAAAKAQADMRGTIEQMQRCSASLSDLLDMLFDLSRPEADRYVPTVLDVPVGEILSDLRVQFAVAAVRKGLRFAVDETEAVVRSDPHLLRRILMNLTSNAIKYTSTGHVHVRAAVQGREVLLTVEDSGPGIPADRQEEVFSEYVRLDGAERPEGLGIGLAIVKRSADLLGHELALVSTPGRGTSFTLRVALGDSAGPRVEPKAAARAAGGPSR